MSHSYFALDMFSHYLVKFSNDIAFKLAMLRVETRGFENSKDFFQIRI